MRIVVACLLSCLCLQGFSQVSVSFGGRSFGPSEVVRATLGNSGKSLSLEVAEIDTDGMTIEYGEELPEFYQLLLDVEILSPIAFPIGGKEALSVNLSNLEYSLETEAFMRQQAAAMETPTPPSMKIDQEEMARRSQEIAMKMQTGEISMEEGSRQIEQLTSGVIESIESMPIPEFVEPEPKAIYSLVLYDTRTLTLTEAYQGVLTIERFNENEFVASFSGRMTESCLERRAAEYDGRGADCGQVQSAIYPETKVLNEGNLRVSINVKLKEFDDYR